MTIKSQICVYREKKCKLYYMCVWYNIYILMQEIKQYLINMNK